MAHPATEQALRFFKTDHLRPGPIKSMADRFAQFSEDLADHCALAGIDDPEVTTGFQKLREAKDRFVGIVAIVEEERTKNDPK